MKVQKNKEFTVEETTILDGVDTGITSDWHGSEVETQGEALFDGGTGGAIILRCFDFKFPPGITQIPTKDQILTPQYLKTLQTILYYDHDMEMCDEARVVIAKDGFKIFIPCTARKGSQIYDRDGLATPKSIQNIHG